MGVNNEKQTIDIIIKFNMNLFSKIHAALVARNFPASCFASNIEQMANERGLSCVRCYNPVRCKNNQVNNKAICGYFSIERASAGTFLQELINVGVKTIHCAENFEELTKELVICCDTCKTEMGFMQPQPLANFASGQTTTTSNKDKDVEVLMAKAKRSLVEQRVIKKDDDYGSDEVNDISDKQGPSFMSPGIESNTYQQPPLPSTSGITYSHGRALFPVSTIGRVMFHRKPIAPVNISTLRDMISEPALVRPRTPPPPSPPPLSAVAKRMPLPPKNWCRCKVCKRVLTSRGKDIYRMKSLKSSHARNHTSKPQFACLHCSFGCRFSGGMNLHMFREHSGIPVAYVDRSREKWYRDEVANIVKTCFIGPEDE